MSALEVYRVLTVRQPWGDLVMAGVKDVENRTWPVPSTLPKRCRQCGGTNPDSTIHTLHPEMVAEGNPFPFRLWIHASKTYDRVAGNKAVMDWAASVSNETRARASGPLLSGVKEMMRFQAPERRGALLGSILVTGCHHADECRRRTGGTVRMASNAFGHEYEHCSRWAESDVYHWTLTDPQPLPEPTPMRGRQGLWTLKGDDLARLGQVLADAEGVTA